jgi:sec-independent protein translocase protein TatA
MLGMQELVMILLIVVVVFGAKRIPEIMGGLGEGIKSFKKALEADDPVSARTEGPTVKDSSGGQQEDAVSHGAKPKERTVTRDR